MSWVRIWVHFVFTSKERIRVLKPLELRNNLYQHIKENAKKKSILIDTIGGFEEHIHCLISLPKELPVSKIMQLIKGESAHWFNKTYGTGKKLIWQDDYWAASVSESHINRVRNYIQNQVGHHKRISFSDELEELMIKYGWKKYQD